MQTKVRDGGMLVDGQGNTAVLVSHIVGEDGLSEKERNLKRTHSIPLYSLVEVTNCTEQNGLRLFVQAHNRDCDGTPLYSLTFDPEIIGADLENKDPSFLGRIMHSRTLGSIMSGLSEECLTVIESAESVKARL